MLQLRRALDSDPSPLRPRPRAVNLTLLPPEQLQILRRVGGDGLLVSWCPPEDDEVTGYLVSSSC